MDMQMPVMDGVTATREMRKLSQLASLPIVAMTANAMEQDRRRCLDAGMNDFLVKPIDPQDMEAILLRWTKPRREAVTAPAATSDVAVRAPREPLAADAAGFLPEIAGLDSALGLSRMMGKKPLYLAMLKRYVAGQAATVSDLRNALARGDAATAERLAHTTKAVSGTVGATGVQQRAAALETAIRDGSGAAQLQRLIEELDTPLDQLLRDLEHALAPEAAHA
jgi:two-component system sensor histidine kinase/response regulator